MPVSMAAHLRGTQETVNVTLLIIRTAAVYLWYRKNTRHSLGYRSQRVSCAGWHVAGSTTTESFLLPAVTASQARRSAPSTCQPSPLVSTDLTSTKRRWVTPGRGSKSRITIDNAAARRPTPRRTRSWTISSISWWTTRFRAWCRSHCIPPPSSASPTSPSTWRRPSCIAVWPSSTSPQRPDWSRRSPSYQGPRKPASSRSGDLYPHHRWPCSSSRTLKASTSAWRSVSYGRTMTFADYSCFCRNFIERERCTVVSQRYHLIMCVLYIQNTRKRSLRLIESVVFVGEDLINMDWNTDHLSEIFLGFSDATNLLPLILTANYHLFPLPSSWLIIRLSSTQHTGCSMLSPSESPGVPKRPGAVLRVERASDEMRASTEAELPGESLAPGGHQMPSAHRSRGRRLERMEFLVALSTRHGGTVVRTQSCPLAPAQWERRGKL